MASPLTVQPCAIDNYLNEDQKTANFGNDNWIQVNNGNPADAEGIRGVLEFSIAALPVGATLDSATLSLYYWYKEGTPSGLTIWAYKLTRQDWHETQSTWNIYKTGSNWTAAGGDYVTSSPAGGSTTFPAGFAWMSWDVLAIVQDAYTNSLDVEILLKFETEGITPGYAAGAFYSRHYATDTTKRPKLVIAYTEASDMPYKNYYPHILAH